MQRNNPKSSEIFTEKLHDDLSSDSSAENIKLLLQSLFEIAQFTHIDLEKNYQSVLKDDDLQNYLLRTLTKQEEINLQIRLEMLLKYFTDTQLPELDHEDKELLKIKKKIIILMNNLILDFESGITKIVESPSKIATFPGNGDLKQDGNDRDKISSQLNDKKTIFVRQLIAILSEILNKSEDKNFIKKIQKIFEKDIYKNSNEGNVLLIMDLKNLCVKKNQQQLSAIIDSYRLELKELRSQDQTTQLKIQQNSERLIDYLKYEFIFNYIANQAKERIEDLKKTDPEFKDDAKVYLNFYRLFNLIGKEAKKDFSINFPNINFRSYDQTSDSFKPESKQIIEFHDIIINIGDNDKFFELLSQEIIKEINYEKESYVSELFDIQAFKKLKDIIEDSAILSINDLLRLGILQDDLEKVVDQISHNSQIIIFKQKISKILGIGSSLEVSDDYKSGEIVGNVIRVIVEENRNKTSENNHIQQLRTSSSPSPLNGTRKSLSSKSSQEKEI